MIIKETSIEIIIDNILIIEEMKIIIFIIKIITIVIIIIIINGKQIFQIIIIKEIGVGVEIEIEVEVKALTEMEKNISIITTTTIITTTIIIIIILIIIVVHLLFKNKNQIMEIQEIITIYIKISIIIKLKINKLREYDEKRNCEIFVSCLKKSIKTIYIYLILFIYLVNKLIQENIILIICEIINICN